MTQVLVLNAVSYTGATWVSLVLGSRPEVLAVGNPERALKHVRENPSDACRIHGASCPLWPAFAAHWDGKGDLFAALAAFSGKETLVLRNPKPEVLSSLDAAGVAQKHIVLVRDLRALTASYMRKNPGKDALQSLADWAINAAKTTHRFLHQPDAIIIQHHKASIDHDYLYAMLSEATGRAYGSEQGRFWEHDHHIVAGNAGTMRTVIAYQQKEEHKQSFYSEFIDRAVSKGDTKFVDERWRSELDRFALYAIDRCVGDYQTELGFERDSFTAEEQSEFAARFDREVRDRRFQHQFPGQPATAGSTVRRLASRALGLIR